jgi:hypothetical protein
MVYPPRLPMWPFVSHTLFPAPTEAWLHTVSSDPEAQGWGAWSRTPLEPRGGDGKEEKNGVAEEDGDEDTSFLLSLLVPENLAMSPVPDSVADECGVWRQGRGLGQSQRREAWGLRPQLA